MALEVFLLICWDRSHVAGIVEFCQTGQKKNLTKGFVQADRDSFHPAFLMSSGGHGEPAYIIEDHGNNHVTVLWPRAPAPFTGSIKIVRRNMLEVMDTNLGEFSKALSHWGVGFRELANKGQKGMIRNARIP